MIRFKVGQSWKREAQGEPRDAFSFEVDGVNLLRGATEEPLLRVVGGLVDAVSAMVVDGEPAGQLSLEDVRLELCFWRRPGLEVEVSVVNVAQPPARARPPIEVELPALVEAAVNCARAFARDLTRQPNAPKAELVALERKVKTLTSTLVAARAERETKEWTASRGGEGLTYVLKDDDGRTQAYTRRSRAGLPALLIDGEVSMGETHVAGLPFLTMMGLARAATEGAVKLGATPLEPSMVFSAGLDLCLALRARSPALGTNPWLEALQIRCADGLKALRQPVPDTSSAAISSPRDAPSAPLTTTGQVRRVALTQVWSRQVALGEEDGQLILGRRALLVASPHAVHGFSLRGETTHRRMAVRGIAANGTHTLEATAQRALLFEGAARSARWLRDHDGTQVGPRLELAGELLLTTLARRSVAGYSAHSGREIWRFDPQRAQRSYFTVLGPRVLVATDAGTVHGIDLASGQVRFSVRSPIPCVQAPVPAGRRALVLLNRGEHTAVYLSDALAGGDGRPAGGVVWTRELMLSGPRGLVHKSGKTFLVGQRDGRTLVCAIGPRGQLLWERPVALEPRSAGLVVWDKGVIATDATGAAVRLLPDGQTTWVLGSSGDQLTHPIAPVLMRGVLVVPGPDTRVVDPSSGRVLAALETGPRLTSLAVDRKLALYALKEPGVLEVWKPSAVLALVPTASRTSR